MFSRVISLTSCRKVVPLCFDKLFAHKNVGHLLFLERSMIADDR